MTPCEWVQFDNTKLRKAIEARKELFNNAIRKASTENIQRRLVREKMRWLARHDLFWLTGQLGASFSKIHGHRDFYEPFCDEVSLMNYKLVYHGVMKPSGFEGLDGKACGVSILNQLEPEAVVDDRDELHRLQRMYLCFRAFWKSSIVTKLHSVQLVLNFPEIHMVLCHNKQDTSSENLESVKALLRTDPLKTWFQELVPNSKEWGNRAGFSVANRTDLGRSEDTVEAVGVGTEVTGKHWQIAKKNDLVTEESTNTEEQIKKTEDWDARFNVGLFDNPQKPFQDYEGTRYHFADLYSVKKNDPNIKVIEIPLEDGEGNPTLERRFSRADILAIKRNTNPWTYSCQHMLNPEDPEKARFKKEDIQYWDRIPEGTRKYLLVDPASARKKKSDYTVMLIIGLCDDRKFVIDGIRDKLNPTQRIEAALELVVRHDIKKVGWETIGFQETDCFYLERKRRELNLHFQLEEIKSHAVSKEDRIRSMIPQYNEHRWFWPADGQVTFKGVFDGRNHDLTAEMEMEYMNFPLSEHDDILDAMTFIDRMEAHSGKETNPERPKPMTYGDLTRDMDRRKAIQDAEHRFSKLKRALQYA